MNAITHPTHLQVQFDAQQFNLCIAGEEDIQFVLPNVHPLLIAEWLEETQGQPVMIADGQLNLSPQDLEAYALANAEHWKAIPMYYSLTSIHNLN